MRLIIIILLILAMSSCTKNCETCDVIVESNAIEALRNCDGEANNYPNGYVESGREQYSNLCGDDLDATKDLAGTISQTEVCNGIFSTIRTRVECK